MKDTAFNEIEHTADWALKIEARDMAELLYNAALGMIALMGLDTADSVGSKRRIEIKAIDREDLLVSWLQELLYLMESRGVSFGGMEIQVKDGTNLAALVEEIPCKSPLKEIKAVTYHNLAIKETEKGLEAVVVFDV
jgi:SHS2 domain-containing protein